MQLVPGTKIKAKQDIFELATEDNPCLILAKSGDVLVIKKTGSLYDYLVAHENITDESCFGIDEEEFEVI